VKFMEKIPLESQESSRSIIPNLTGVALNYTDRFTTPENKTITSFFIKRSPNRESLLFDFFRSLDKAINEKKVDIGKLPSGGAICEIGGPSWETAGDFIFAKPDKYVVTNPGFENQDKNSSIYMSDQRKRQKMTKFREKEEELLGKKMPTPIEYTFSVDNEEAMKKIVADNGKFDYVTAYNVFGDETRHISVDDFYGADLSSAEKRIGILKNLQSLVKENGVLALATARGFGGPVKLGFDKQEMNEHGFYELNGNNDKENKPFNGQSFYLFQYRSQ
jgi:hypothetical protein